MITICESNECTGCGVCENVCSTEAIKMKYDYNGFLHPAINSKKCINCEKCIRSCPQNNLSIPIMSKRNEPTVFACTHIDSGKSNTSTSGGAFQALADYVMDKGSSVVFGAWYDPVKRVVQHVGIDNSTDIVKVKGSKYIQSEIGLSYSNVKKSLQKGKWVLFSGCPCQVEALYYYLGKDYEKLITMDVICHGVGSTSIFQRYLKEMENQIGNKIIGYKFRDKSNGWTKKQISITFSDGRVKAYPSNKDSFMRCYYQRAIYRQACYTCRSARLPRNGDFTVGDYFSVPTKVLGRSAEKNGISMLLVNSPKADYIFQNINKDLLYSQRTLDEAISTNSNLVMPSKMPDYYESIVGSSLSIKELADKYCSRTFMSNMKARVKEILIRSIKR